MLKKHVQELFSAQNSIGTAYIHESKSLHRVEYLFHLFSSSSASLVRKHESGLFPQQHISEEIRTKEPPYFSLSNLIFLMKFRKSTCADEVAESFLDKNIGFIKRFQF
jgi:hypothetical protein